jgi:Mg2+ and Co2+ transporter CorA
MKIEQLSKREIIILQLFGYVYIPEKNILVDAIIGQQTRDIRMAVSGQGKLTKRAKEWKMTYTATLRQEKMEQETLKQSNEGKERQISSQSSFTSLSSPSSPSSSLTLSDVDVPYLFTNPSFQNRVDTADIALPPEKTQQAIENVFVYLARYLDITTKEHENFLEQFTIASNGINGTAQTLTITGTLKSEIFSEGGTSYGTPMSISYDISS